HELLVTKTGRVEDEPGSRKLYQLILDSLHARRKPGTTEDLLSELRRLEVPTDRSAPKSKVLEESGGSQHIRFESEPGIEIDARLYVPSSPGKKPAAILLAGRLSDLVAEPLAKTGVVVLKLEPRRSTTFDDRRPFVGDWQANTRADQIGVCLP